MHGALFRMKPEAFMFIFLSFIVSTIIALNVNFDRFYYEALMKTEFGESEVGYQAHSGIERISSIEEAKNNWLFTIETNRKNLVATGEYKNVFRHSYYNNGPHMWMQKAMGNEIFGQFYILTLPSNERIVIFLDDNVLKLKGDITLPIGRIEKGIPISIFGELEQKYDLTEADWYVDMSGYEWRGSVKGKKARVISENIFTVSLLAIIVIVASFYFRSYYLAWKNGREI